MKHLRKFNESNSVKRISNEIIDTIEILSNHNSPFDINVFECLDKINNMSQEELDEFYLSISSNRRENNSDEENFMLDIINRFNFNTSFDKDQWLKESKGEDTYEGYYIIGWGLSGGFGGIHNYEVIKAESVDEAEKDAYQRALDEYENYSGYHGLRSVSDIMEEDDVEEDEAEEIYNEEREGWLDYVSMPYSKESEKKLSGYHFDNPYKEEIDSVK
jgi:hypothetical protein